MNKRMKALSLLLAFSFVLASAGCADKAKSIQTKDEVAVHDDTLKLGALKNLNDGKQEEPMLTAQMTNYLLYGYNVLQNGYIDSGSIDKKTPIIDAKKLTSDDYEAADGTKSNGTCLTSYKVSKLYSSFDGSASASYSGVFFSGSVSTDYSESSQLSEETSFIKYMQFHRIGEMYYKVDIDRLKELLTDGFLKDVREKAISDPGSVLSKYGTHLITQYYIGGRAEINYEFSNMTQSTDQEIQVSANAAYKCFSGTASAKEKQQAELVLNNSTLSFHSMGGDNLTGDTVNAISGKYDAWVKTIETKPVISGIADFDKAMVPIWELVDDPKAADSLKAKFHELAKSAEANLEKLNPKEQFVSEIVVYSRKKSADAIAQIPSGYTRVLLNPKTYSTELLEANKGAGGDYIYIAYKMTTDKSQAITDIATISGKNSGVSLSGYTKVNMDLNANAGGKFIYICYKKASAEDAANPDTKYVKEIRGIYGKNYTMPGGWEWLAHGVDLNEGAGGEFIYLGERREKAETK